jgi:nitroreductase
MEQIPDPPMIPLRFERLAPEESARRAVAYAEELRGRRTVRHFSAEGVDRVVIESIVAAAHSAPSGANKQPWRFVVVADPELKRQIRTAAEAEERESYERRMPPEWLEDLAPLGTDWHKEFLEIAPYLIVVFAVSYIEHEGRRRKNYYVQESVGIACGMLLAAAHHAGLATLTHTPSPMNFLARILGRPENERPYLLIPIGYPAPDAVVPDLSKKPLDDVLQWRA